MPKTEKIAISLPEDLLAAVERECESSGESRSEIFRRAVEALLHDRREQEMAKRYAQAYRDMPEGQEEIKAARRAASDILASEPWE